MNFGVTVMLTDRSIGPAELAREVEAHGLDGLYLPEHTHIPVSRETPAPMGDPLPEPYRRLYDPFVALSAAAVATERIALGTGICLVAQHDPIVLAKTVASLDLLAGGRFVFGVGFGWNVEEMADHGVPYDGRRAIALDKLAAMRVLWREEEAAYAGPHVSFEATWSWPKPVDGPPVWFGVGAGPSNLDLLVEQGDGWIPIGGSGLRQALPELRRRLEEAGRDPSNFPVVPFGSTPDAGKFAYFAGLGIDHVVANAPSGTRDEVLPWLERYAEVVEEFR